MFYPIVSRDENLLRICGISRMKVYALAEFRVN